MKIFQKIVIVHLAGFFPEYHMSIEYYCLVFCQEVLPILWVDGVLKAFWQSHWGVSTIYSPIQNKDVGDDVMSKYWSQIDNI